MNRNGILAVATLAALAVAPAAFAQPQTVVSCLTAGIGSADPTTRGFYVANYPAESLGEVTLTYYAANPGTYNFVLSASIDSFTGTRVASRFASVNFPTANAPVQVTFNFDGVSVTRGQTLLFEQTVLGPGEDTVLFDTGMGSCAATETVDFTPPLSTSVRDSVGLTITAPPAGACVPNGTTMCISNVLGDNRFSVGATYKTSQSGGLSGEGHSVSTENIGVTEGSLLWFFNEANPEMLVKVLNGCAVNNYFWVFYAADTNVGFTVSVTDTTSGATKNYTNNDLTAATPVQDTAAFPCS